MTKGTRQASAYDEMASRVGNALNGSGKHETTELGPDCVPAPVDADHGQHLHMDDNPMTPDYYKAEGVETIDYLHAFLTEDEFNGFCKGNIIKYVSRANRKNGVEDIRKARDYIRYLITSMEGEWS